MTRPRLAALILAPGLGAAVALALVWRDPAGLDTGLPAHARAAAASIDAALDARLAAGRRLAASAALERGDLAAFEVEARAAAEALGAPVMLIGPGPDYLRLLSTALPPGQRPRYGGLILPDAEAPLPRVFADGVPRVTNLGRSIASGRPNTLILSPVLRQDAVVQVIGIGFEPAHATQLLLRQELPAGVVATVVDGQGRVIASTGGDDDVADRPAPAWMTGEPEAGRPMHTLRDDGAAIAGTVVKLERAEWTLAVQAPSDQAVAGRVAAILVALCGALLAGGLAILRGRSTGAGRHPGAPMQAAR